METSLLGHHQTGALASWVQPAISPGTTDDGEAQGLPRQAFHSGHDTPRQHTRGGEMVDADQRSATGGLTGPGGNRQSGPHRLDVRGLDHVSEVLADVVQGRLVGG